MTEAPTLDDGVLLDARGLVRDFRSGDGVIHVLRGVDLAVRRGAILGITGRSGAGKTTLLNILGALDRPDAGSVAIDGVDLDALDDSALVRIRRETVSHVFQASSLVPILSAAENVEIPLRLRGAKPAARDARVAEMLEGVGLGPRAAHRPEELSGGEQQRVAVARALAGRPVLVLADEPTAQLDHDTSRSIAALLRRAVAEDGMTIVLTSHDPTLLEIADEVLELREGVLVARATH
jgi:putative ABC transport system ATP-binding protein